MHRVETHIFLNQNTAVILHVIGPNMPDNLRFISCPLYCALLSLSPYCPISRRSTVHRLGSHRIPSSSSAHLICPRRGHWTCCGQQQRQMQYRFASSALQSLREARRKQAATAKAIALDDDEIDSVDVLGSVAGGRRRSKETVWTMFIQARSKALFHTVRLEQQMKAEKEKMLEANGCDDEARLNQPNAKESDHWQGAPTGGQAKQRTKGTNNTSDTLAGKSIRQIVWARLSKEYTQLDDKIKAQLRTKIKKREHAAAQALLLRSDALCRANMDGAPAFTQTSNCTSSSNTSYDDLTSAYHLLDPADAFLATQRHTRRWNAKEAEERVASLDLQQQSNGDDYDGDDRDHDAEADINQQPPLLLSDVSITNELVHAKRNSVMRKMKVTLRALQRGHKRRRCKKNSVLTHERRLQRFQMSNQLAAAKVDGMRQQMLNKERHAIVKAVVQWLRRRLFQERRQKIDKETALTLQKGYHFEGESSQDKALKVAARLKTAHTFWLAFQKAFKKTHFQRKINKKVPGLRRATNKTYRELKSVVQVMIDNNQKSGTLQPSLQLNSQPLHPFTTTIAYDESGFKTKKCHPPPHIRVFAEKYFGDFRRAEANDRGYRTKEIAKRKRSLTIDDVARHIQCALQASAAQRQHQLRKRVNHRRMQSNAVLQEVLQTRQAQLLRLRAQGDEGQEPGVLRLPPSTDVLSHAEKSSALPPSGGEEEQSSDEKPQPQRAPLFSPIQKVILNYFRAQNSGGMK